jgi:hypothetical protein
MFVARPDQRLADSRSALSDRQRFPILRLCLSHQPIELVLSFKDRAEWQSRFEPEHDRANQQHQNDNFPGPHIPYNSTRNLTAINSDAFRTSAQQSS